MSRIGVLTGVRWDALDPSPDRARTLLRGELLRPEYHDENPIQQFLHWISRKFESGLNSASQTSPLGALGTIVVFMAILLLIAWLISRARRTPRAASEAGAVLTEEMVTAADLRARAEAALAAGNAGDALVDGFRAVTLRQIERGWIEDQPGATAHEVAVRLSTAFTDHRQRIEHSADLFDAVLYGDRPVSADQARGMLALDDDLARLVGAR